MSWWLIGTDHLQSKPRNQSKPQQLSQKEFETMPKLNLNIDGVDQDAAEGYASWSGPLPETGSYPGKLKIVQIKKTGQKAKNPGAPMLIVGVELLDAEPKEAIGYVAFRNLVLLDQTIPFVNQFLRALTDG